MATFKIPNSNGQIRQLGINDTFGELWSTFNIDLHTNPGKIKLARPMRQVADDEDLEGEDVQAFLLFNGDAYALTESDLFRDTASPYETWNLADDEVSNGQDMVIFDGQIVITTITNLDAFDGSSFTSNWWTARGNPSITNGIPHILEVLRIGAETLAVTDGSQVHAYTGGIDSGAVLSVTVDLPSEFVASCIKSTIRSVFIGTYTETGEQAYVYEWDGASTNYTQAYPVGAKAVLAMEVIDDVPIIVTERGEIKMFNNAGFTTIAQFPFASKPVFISGVETGNIQTANISRPIHPKGMKRAGNIVYIFVGFENGANNTYDLDERTHKGLWALDLTTHSLTHLNQSFQSSVSSPIMVINDEGGRIFLGCRNDVGGDNSIWIEDLDDDSPNYGYFVTSEIESDSVSDALEKLYLKALLGEDDEIIVKYRISRDVELPLTIEDVTWSGVNENEFQSDDTSLAHIKSRFDAGHRDEVEVLVGQGAGRLCHITNVTYSAPTYTITVDEALGEAGQESIVRFDNWKKIPVSMTAADGELKKFGAAGENATWCQFKVELRGRAGLPEVRQLIVKTNNKESL